MNTLLERNRERLISHSIQHTRPILQSLFDLKLFLFCFMYVCECVCACLYISSLSAYQPIEYPEKIICIFIRLFYSFYDFVFLSVRPIEKSYEKRRDRSHLSVFDTIESVLQNRFETRSIYSE